MPSRNIIKSYLEGGYYHIYNRGVEKRIIFQQKQDCVVLQRYIKLYLSPPEEVEKIRVKRLNSFLTNNMHGDLELLAFSLMPNHIHLLVRQQNKDAIVKFMRRLTTSYVMYFNNKYNRVGPLFQNAYKAALVESDSYLMHLSRYIHLNPNKLAPSEIDFADFTSLPYYTGEKQAAWLNTKPILDYFSISRLTNKGISYLDFVNNHKEAPNNILGGLIIEED